MEHNVDVAVIGAGPVGMFTVFEAGMMGYSCALIDSLDELGGQLTALYPEKPIYDIPGFPSVLASDLISNIEQQIKPFEPTVLLGSPASSLKRTETGFELIAGKTKVNARGICIAAGGGMFAPRKPPIENLEQFEDSSVFYSVKDKSQFDDKNVVIAGGGDSAVDWAVALAETAKHIHIIHRRNEFRAAEETVKQLHSLAKAGKITIHTPCQLKSISGTGDKLQNVEIADLDGNSINVEAEKMLCFFGISPSLGPIADWGLGISKKKITVDPETMNTSVEGIVGAGDIIDYPAKLHLILSGFAESALAMRSLQKFIDPDKKYRPVFSTSKGVPNS